MMQIGTGCLKIEKKKQKITKRERERERERKRERIIYALLNKNQHCAYFVLSPDITTKYM